MRRKRAKTRDILPDPRFGDELVAKFVNGLMQDGKKSLAYTIFYSAIDGVKEKTNEDGLIVWKKALDNIMPSVEVKRRRVGGSTFQVPREIRPERRLSLGIKWLVSYARSRGEKTMKERLIHEIIAASNEEGNAFKRKVDTHRMASSNKAFSHFNF